jgi:uncharacterized protein (DUF305 family)
MTPLTARVIAAALLTSVAGTASRAMAQTPVQTTAQASMPPGGRPYSQADVNFLTGMIAHHSQAILIAGWAPSHGASPSIRTLCERIVVGQRDEIAFMQRMLREHNQPVPDPAHPHMMAGMDHPMLMPGMLTPEQLAQLDAARGQEFDKLFLTFMIQHHRGALTMIDTLYASPGAAQDDVMFKVSSDMSADQSTEIDRMTNMLFDITTGSRASQ